MGAALGGGGGSSQGVGLRKLDERGAKINRWRRLDNGSVKVREGGNLGGLMAGGGGD